MCLILFSYNAHPSYRIVLAANRDEFYRRPTSALHEWQDTPALLAGRDLQQMGTWLGITRSGRLAAITNYRDMANQEPKAPSRGHLVSDFLKSTPPPSEYLESLKSGADRYNGFNLIVGTTRELYYFSNQNGAPRQLAPGIHGLSNHLLDTPWPKVERGRQALGRMLASNRKILDPDDLLHLLLDQYRPSDHLLPDTGVGLEKERMLSPMFITSPDYGTRSSSVLLIDNHGFVIFVERTWEPGRSSPVSVQTRRFSFRLE